MKQMNDEIEYLRKVYQSEDTSTWVNKLQMKSIVDYSDKLQSNWNSLREWLEYVSKDLEFTCYYNEVLEKMNELESGEKK